ncbi:MAG TPA: hypothetical protein VHU42_11860, partial [Rhodopila sp.]|nr:hypothetical protein [Rhodopila sp.]
MPTLRRGHRPGFDSPGTRPSGCLPWGRFTRGRFPSGRFPWVLTSACAALVALPALGFAADAPAKPTASPADAKSQTAPGRTVPGKTTAGQTTAGQTTPAEQPLADPSRIAAVVNGDVISNADIANRARLFAISTGLPLSPEV